MGSCSICGKDAVYFSRVEGRHYCEEHFLRWFDRRVRRTIRKYRFFSKKERIVVAVSGGKDSLSALHFLRELASRAPDWEVKALLVDEGIRGYRDETVKDFLKYVDEHDVEYKIITFEEELGHTLDEIVSEHPEESPCTYCGVFRRYLLNKGAREMGATVIVTGHNLDDVVQTFLMNLMRNDVPRLARLGPVTGVADQEGFIRRVKLFYEVLEKEVTVYSILNGFFPGFTECPYAREGMRWDIRKSINSLEEKYPGTKHTLLASLLRMLPVLKEHFVGRPSPCPSCGEPTSGSECRACQLLKKLER